MIGRPPNAAPRNRRVVAPRSSREQLLDVRVRRSTARRRRTHRALSVVLGLMLWAGLARGRVVRLSGRRE